MNKIDLKDKIAVITGGAQGFGYAIAKRFISSNAKVIILDNDPTAIAEAIDLKEIKFNDSFETDIANYNDVAKTIKEIINKYSQIDIFIIMLVLPGLHLKHGNIQMMIGIPLLILI